MPKAYDVKHNYYADLDLPTTASVDDVKKQYRKLALQYHPDRNAGKEDEYIPKFQAIQAAHEILGEPAEKTRYDADRRKAGLYPTSGGAGGAGGGGARGNPYQAASAYPPPPRRTQPGAYQRPQGTGADRFTNFPRSAPTAKRADPAAERQNAFKAWQNMNNAQDRQQQQARYAQASASAQAKTASPRRPGPPPPPRSAEPKFPTDEKIRAGFTYREPPQAAPAPENAEDRQSAWAAFQKSHANSPGVRRSNTNKTPKKQGFDPNMPGSDEGMAPDSQYAHRHKSADFGRPSAAPPPPPRTSQPGSPRTTPQRPQMDPLRPFKSRTGTADDDAPYSEGNRVRTPYSSFSGERTDFGGDMRRSNSTRDTSKLHAESNRSRARSTSPLDGARFPQPKNGKASFSVGGSSSTSSANSDAGTPNQQNTPFAQPGKTTVPPQERRKIVPSPPSRRFNGSANPSSPPAANGNAMYDNEMKQKSSSNMYVNTSPSPLDTQRSLFSPGGWTAQMFGSGLSKNGHRRFESVPKWAVPASVLPQRKSAKRARVELPNGTAPSLQPVSVDAWLASSDEAGLAEQRAKLSSDAAAIAEQTAYLCLRQSLVSLYGSLPQSLDMDVFLALASTARSGKSTGLELVDRAMADTLARFPTVGYRLGKKQLANSSIPLNRFSFPTSPEMFSPTANSKSRSEESINTKFSADGWSGTFSGSADYFAPPQASSRRGSPSQRGGQRPSMRTATSSYGQNGSAAQSPTATTTMPPPPRPYAVPQDGTFPDPPSAGSDTKFSKEQWEQTFKDGSWTWPPPPSQPPPSSPAKGGARKQASRKNSRAAHSKPTSSSSGSGTAANPHVVDEEDDQKVNPQASNNRASMNSNGGVNEPDAMDIDNTPPATEYSTQPPSHTEQAKEPRLVSVPPSAWRQSQQPHPSNSHHRTTSSGSNNIPLKANLNDLANVAPFNQNSDGSGLQDLNSMSATLPFTSQAANTLPTNPLKPQTLTLPVVPIPPKAPTRLNKQSWHTYAQNFGVYLLAFNSFNTAMLQHFQARHQEAATRMQKGMGWLEAAGDAIVGGGFGSYAREVKEDERVRETWNMGCERQADAVKEFDEVRERVRRLAAAGTIADQ